MTAAALQDRATVRGTVMFTDIVGFTEFNAIRGDAEAVELLSLQERIVKEELPDDARIVSSAMGLWFWFEDACDAIETGLRLQVRFGGGSLEQRYAAVGARRPAPRPTNAPRT